MCSFIFLPKFTIDSIRQFENEQNIFFLFIGICQKTLHSPKFRLHSNKRNIDDEAKNVNFQSRYANKIENGHQILGTTGLIKLFFSSSYFLCMCCVSSWQFFFLLLCPSKVHNVKFIISGVFVSSLFKACTWPHTNTYKSLLFIQH